MNVAKMQSEREYKKDYEKSKTTYHTPVEMVSIQAAKQAQDVASNTNYKRLIHQYICLPDNMTVELARNRMQIQSDVSNAVSQTVTVPETQYGAIGMGKHVGAPQGLCARTSVPESLFSGEMSCAIVFFITLPHFKTDIKMELGFESEV